ncbi:hypothetical protein PFTANZ_06681, partial [Plasmodium falciparum Tanzania (2000708)]
MVKRSGKNGETKSSLEGDIKNAKFKNKAVKENTLNDVCNIKKEHSNDSRGNSDGPCTGKDERFKIGNGWKILGKDKTSYKNVIMPQRREHMCTSNLEYLNLNSTGLTSDKAIHSLLGDVLLAANKEAGFIKDRYKDQKTPKDFKDEATVCRAIKYSFADIGDIIKGTDLWDLNGGEKTTQENLVKIFNTIKEKLPQNIKDKYTGDKAKPPHRQLRADWWEANRAKVWNAMKCHIKELKDKSGHQSSPSDHCGYSKHIPPDDYIPQRLRWMTEWAEWFCKDQSKEYDTLQKACSQCKTKDKDCTQSTPECDKCKAACTTYGQKIKEWADQWKHIKDKYEELYEQAKTTSTNPGPTAFPDDDPDYQQVVHFFKELQKQNSGKTTYDTAAGYIHQEARTRECLVQNEFCEKENGVAEKNEKYAFSLEPHEYKGACECKPPQQESPAPSETGTDPEVDDDEDEDDDDDDDDGLPKKRDTRTNPCYSDTTTEYAVLAEKVAHQMHDQARQQLTSRGSKDELKGNISLAEFKNGGQGSELKGNICKIDNKYSNDIRGTTNGGACKGKDGGQVRFKIGTGWSHIKEKEMSYKDVFLPPRREHMCTSNLENLDVVSVIKNGKASHSLLGDVLLAAYREAERTKKHFKDKNDDHTACRAVRYSFADLADIIRGRDMWDKDDGSRGMETKLKAIFKNIKEQHPEIQKQYRDDDKEKHTKLREDWWEANRETVWKAMQCTLKELKISTGDCAYSRGTYPPVDDYIPQRLRWMTEWAEWYCKMQSQQYDELMGKCCIFMSMNKGNGGQGCTSGDDDCEKCKPECEKYKNKIKSWEKQWNKIKAKYEELYEQARTVPDRTGFNDGSPDYQQVVAFFKKLQEANGDTTLVDTTSPYFTAAGYIHQELPHTQCQIQKHFCTSGDNEDKDYVFREKPNDHDNACDCYKKTASSPEELGRRERNEDEQSPQTPDHSESASDEVEEDEEVDPNHVDSESDSEDVQEDEEAEDEHGPDGDEDADDGAEPEAVKVKEEVKTEEAEKAPQQEAVDTAEVTEQVKGPQGPKVEDICATVSTALTKGDLNAACKQKYSGNNSRLGWKCIPTTKTTGSEATTSSGTNQGAICVPPRRRRLYIQKLHEWANSSGNETTEASSEPTLSPPSNSRDVGLRDAFIESAAVETFFLWDRYKKLNAPQSGSSLGVAAPQAPKLPGAESDDNNPQDQLANGTIPTDFLRLMFYTLGDYRDILVRGGGDENSGSKKKDGDSSNHEKNLVVLASGKENEANMKNIQKAIDEHINSLNKASTVSQKPGQSPQTQRSDKTRQTLWGDFAQDIWNGMIYALTYKEDTDSGGEGKSPQVDQKVRAQLWDNDGKKPKQNGKYNYHTVTLKDEQSGDDPLKNPKLTQFVLRPTYFRYLEEWGETFCRERKKRLRKIEGDCTQGGERCSGDGENCNEIVIDKNKIFDDFKCNSCAISCSSYRKWIKKKRTEYDEQTNAYSEQKTKCHTQSKDATSNNNANGFCGTLGTCNEAKDFLGKLGPCKNDSAEDNKEDKLDFDKPNDTFKPATNCDPCSEFKIKCENCNSSGGSTQKKCPKGKITEEDIKNKGKFTDRVDMLVSDNSATEFKNGLEACQDKCIFEGIKENKWECGEVCGVDICTLEKKDTNGQEGDKKYITMKELIKRWIEYFFVDYNMIKKKLKACIKNEKNKLCINGCCKNCDCVEKWIKKKKEEWQRIKDRYLKQYESKDEDFYYNLKSFLNQGIFESDKKKAIEPCGSLDEFQESRHCAVDANSKSGEVKKKDIVECLFQKLKEKATSCPGKPSGDTQAKCQESPLEPDEEDLLLEEEENTVKAPKICGEMKEETKEQEEDACKAAAEEPEKPVPEAGGEENPYQPLVPEPEKKVLPAPAPAAPPAAPAQPTLPADEPFNRDILATTIPF